MVKCRPRYDPVFLNCRAILRSELEVAAFFLQTRGEKNAPLPTAAEMRLLQVLWDLGSASVEQVLDAHDAQSRPNYKTTQTLLRIMEGKGFITHEAQGRVFVFRPLITRKTVDQRSVQTLLHQNFGGSPADLFVNLLEAGTVKEEELAELEASIRRYRERQQRSHELAGQQQIPELRD